MASALLAASALGQSLIQPRVIDLPAWALRMTATDLNDRGDVVGQFGGPANVIGVFTWPAR